MVGGRRVESLLPSSANLCFHFLNNLAEADYSDHLLHAMRFAVHW